MGSNIRWERVSTNLVKGSNKQLYKIVLNYSFGGDE